jgi:hypothetical protein
MRAVAQNTRRVRSRPQTLHLPQFIEQMLFLIVLQKRDTAGARVSRWDEDLSRRRVWWQAWDGPGGKL